MRVYCRSNLAELRVVANDEPWTLPAFKWPEGATKEMVQRIWLKPETKHYFISTFEGMTETEAISTAAKNRPVKMHGLIVDYDARVSDAMIEELKNSPPPSEYLPAWAVHTFSGNARLVWNFEEPVLISSDAQVVAFLAYLTRRLSLGRWLAGLDTKCLRNVYQYYELGAKWTPFSPNSKVPRAFLNQWLFEASRTIRLLRPDEKKYDIPIELVAKEVNARYPGRWKGDFELGRRGVRFWDPTADNETAAVVCEDGMLCFTGPSGFMSWKAIFGESFVESYTALRVDTVLSRALWDERRFWVKMDDDNWESWASDQFARWLKCQGFSSKPEKAGGASEVDEVMVQVQMNKRIRGALPFIFRPHGPIEYRGERILNISRVQVMRPAEAGIFKDEADAVTHFPFIWAFMTRLLEPIDGKSTQLLFLLNWMKCAYESGYYYRPKPGQALVLAGAAGKGKTFFTTVILSRMLGGSGDSADYLVRGSQWTNQLAKWPIAVIDDQQGAATYESHMQFSALVKKLVANQTMSYNGKWEATGEVEWNGRVVICCNDDPESIRLIPNLDHSVSDKLSMLKINADSDFVFPSDREETSRIVNEELPYFCRFLLDMRCPDELINHEDTRYFLKPYYHPELYRFASRGGQAYTVFELLAKFLDGYAKQYPDRPFWEGTSTELFQCLDASNQHATLGGLTPRKLGTSIGQMRSKGIRIGVIPSDKSGVQCWRIPVGLTWVDSRDPLAETAQARVSFVKEPAEPTEEVR